jgi:hypothetical protein
MPEAAAVELTKFTPPQPTGFEFRHQPFGLLAASPPSNANLSDFRHPSGYWPLHSTMPQHLGRRLASL